MLKFPKLMAMVFILVGCGSQKKQIKSAYQDWRASQKTFKSSDGKLKYIDEGKGEVILLLHGVPSSSWLYRKMIPELSQKGYRVIAPDMLGFGSSDNPKGYEIYSPEQHAKRLLELMNSLNIEHWHQVVHDAGGLWTWETIKQDATKIKSLTLLNTIIYEEGFHPPIRMKKNIFTKFAMWMYKNGITTNVLLKMLFKEGLNENNLSKNDIEGYKRPLLEGKTRAMYQFFSNTCNNLPNYEHVFSKLNIPIQVIWGENDEMLQLKPQQEKVEKGLQVAAKNIHYIDAKHFIQEEQPKEISELIEGFLKDN